MASSARIQLAVLFVLLVAIAALVEKSAAATYVVGDTMGWTIPSGGASSYASWAARHTFRPGDVLGTNIMLLALRIFFKVLFYNFSFGNHIRWEILNNFLIQSKSKVSSNYSGKISMSLD